MQIGALAVLALAATLGGITAFGAAVGLPAAAPVDPGSPGAGAGATDGGSAMEDHMGGCHDDSMPYGHHDDPSETEMGDGGMMHHGGSP